MTTWDLAVLGARRQSLERLTGVDAVPEMRPVAVETQQTH